MFYEGFIVEVVEVSGGGDLSQVVSLIGVSQFVRYVMLGFGLSLLFREVIFLGFVFVCLEVGGLLEFGLVEFFVDMDRLGRYSIFGFR